MPVAKPVKVGDRFGRLVVLRELESVRSPNGSVSRMVECRCVCGEVRGFRLPLLRNGKTKSCGCLARELAAERGHKYGGGNKTHGGTGTLEYQTWGSMKDRCTNPSNMGWLNYGGRGISVCDRWLNSFPAFLEDMGRRPGVGHSIHRVDNDGNYEPENCVWATSQEQARNKRNTVYVEHNGETVLLVELAETLADECDVPRKVIEDRLRSGMSPNEAKQPKKPYRAEVEFYGEMVEFGELAFRFGTSPDEVRVRMKRGMSLEEALTHRKHDGDGFYRTPVAERNLGWYREYERREFDGWCAGMSKFYGVDVAEFKPRIQAAIKAGEKRSGAIMRALRELGAVESIASRGPC